ncbi:MAG: pyridoxal phosphate-dependent aminotransferase [Vicinamibacterales bacterium]
MKDSRLAARIGGIALSGTMKTAIEADRLKRSGADVVDLGAGEPDFSTPAHIIAAAEAALHAGFTKYTPNPGILELREAICLRYRLDHGVEYQPDEIIVTAGGKQALFHAAMALFGPGDEVITHAPGWPTIAAQVTLAGATPVCVNTPTAVASTLEPSALLDAMSPRTRGIVIISPGNPTGALLADADAVRLAAEAARRGIWVVLDLCYDRLIYDGTPHSLVRIFSEAMRDRLVLCGSASKTYAMTGWRCGWMAAPADVVRAVNALQSHQTSNVNSIAQKATVAALTGPQDCVARMRTEYQQRRDALMGWLSEEPRLRVARPAGAFYLFPDVGALLSAQGCRSSAEFAERLLQQEHVVVTPGEAFAARGHVRLSYATSLDRLHEGATRLVRFARSLSRA